MQAFLEIFDIYLLEAVINGILLGGVLALLALGLNLIFGVIDVTWICYAELVMIGMYGMYYLFTVYHVPYWVAAPICILLVAGLGALLHFLVIEPLLSAAPINQLLATGGVLFVLQSFATVAFGIDFRNLGIRLPILAMGEMHFSYSRLLAFIAAGVGMIAVYFFMTRTYTGTAIRAIAQDRQIMALMGVDTRRMYIVTSALGGGLAGQLDVRALPEGREVVALFGVMVLEAVRPHPVQGPAAAVAQAPYNGSRAAIWQQTMNLWVENTDYVAFRSLSADYRVPDFLIDETRLIVELFETETLVTSRLKIRRNPAANSPQAPLVLNDADGKFYRRFLRSLVRQVRYLRHTAMEARDGVLSIFLPPVASGDDYVDLLCAIEDVAAAQRRPVVIDGYPPPFDPRLRSIKVTPDPGVIEVNVRAVLLGIRAAVPRLRARGGGHIVAVASTNCWSSPAIVKWVSGLPSRAARPPPT
mgnify:CR=1 FL=1